MSTFLDSFDFKRQTSLYLHIPFCLSKCSYCAFYSKPGICSNEIESYVNALVTEIDQTVERLKKPFYTAFIGGGNPFCLSPDQLEKICTSVCRYGRPLEFTTEMNPESADDRYAYLFKRYFTRLSMGVQSLNSNALNFLGRNASLEQTLKGIEWAKKIENEGTKVSFDMISCLGSFHDALSDVKNMVENFSPKHLSVYALTMEESTELYRRNVQLPDNDEQATILYGIWNYLKDKGFKHYEVSNFAQNGNESLHNMAYWDYQQYIGLGCAAASTGIKNGCYVRYTGERDFAKFASLKEFSCYEKESLSELEAFEEFVLMGVRHKKGLSLERLKKEFGKSLSVIPLGFSEKDGFLFPSDEGLMTSDAAALSIIQALS